MLGPLGLDPGVSVRPEMVIFARHEDQKPPRPDQKPQKRPSEALKSTSNQHLGIKIVSNLVETPGIVSHRDTNCSFGLAKGWCRTAVSSKSTACCGTVCAGWDCTCGVFLRRATRATPEYCGSLMQIKREPLDLLEVRHLTGHLNSKKCQLM